MGDVRERETHEPAYSRFGVRPWGRSESRGLVLDDQELGGLTVVDGTALTDAGERTVEPTPGENHSIQRPPPTILEQYRQTGLTLGHPLTEDRDAETEPIALPEDLQPMHVAWFGKTGSGKSTALTSAMLDNHQATNGASILIDPKGDGMATDYMRAHYATYGHLNNVLYFDCARTLPAFSFFDIRDQLDAGVPRTTAVEDSVDHYIEILGQLMGTDRFERAVRSPDIIRYMVKALYDPVSGDDAFSHRDLHDSIRKLHERQSAPAVSDDHLERMLAGVTANSARSFDEIMQGVANRIEKIPIDQRLAAIFDHVPREEDPHFDLIEYLDENVVIILDTGSLRPSAQRALTLVVLSNLWTALKRRRKHTDGELSLVNLYVEEAASIAASDLLSELLAQARSFGCSLTLAMQFPAQLEHEDRIYDEILNNVSTIVTGNVPSDRELAMRLATDDMNAKQVGNRLRALQRGQWLVKLPNAYGQPEPRPFSIESVTPPAGHPAHDHTPPRTDEWAFQDTLLDVHERTTETCGLTLDAPTTTSNDDKPTSDDPSDDADDTETSPDRVRVDSALPHTNRMPPTVTYEHTTHALRCTECENRYNPTITGMKRAISCCDTLDNIDREDVPICDLNLKLTPEERAVTDWTTKQLLFLQAVYNAQQLRYDPLEYDLLRDSMIRLQEYVDIESNAIQDLIDADLLRHDTDHPHRLYTVPPDGRTIIGESYRQGVDYGHGHGDLEESSLHVLAIEVARQYLNQEYVENPESEVTQTIPYYDIDERRRLDLAGINDNGEVIVAVEAERINHDIHHAVPEDYDKIADTNVDEAIWVVMKQADAHKILAVLNNPPDGTTRIEKTYAKTTPPQQFRIDTPGLTAMYPVEWLRDKLHDS
nr:type IV secretion system DNA-binding domain-containing protein [Halorubellus salinus]